MYPIKQSTAIAVMFFAHDENGDAVTGITDGNWSTGVKRISKNGAAFGAMTVTISEEENGFYSFTLSASHSDTLGILTIKLNAASCKQVNLQFRVHARIPDDLAYPATSGRSLGVETDGHVHADLKEWLGVAPLAMTAQRVVTRLGSCDTDVINNNAIASNALQTSNFAAGAITDQVLGSDCITASKIADDAIVAANFATNALEAVWDELKADHVIADSFGDYLDTEVSGAGGDDAATIWTYGTRVLTANDNLNDPTAAVIADAVWDELVTGHDGAGKAGQQLWTDVDAILEDTNELQTDDIPAAISGLNDLAQADILDDATPFSGADIAAILADTGTDGVVIADGGITAAKIAGDAITDAKVAADVTIASVTGAVGSVTAEVDADVTKISGSATAADNLEASALCIVSGLAQTGTLSTTQMTTDLTEATDDHYNGRVIVFRGGVLDGQATDITDYDGGTNMLTFTAVTDAPLNNQAFTIV